MTTAPTAPPATIDGHAFISEAERITNNALAEEWLALYHPDAVLEWIADGAFQRHQGADEVRAAVLAQASLWRERGLRVTKHLEAATADTVVVSFRGGFGGRTSQFGVEIWTLDQGLVVRHQMYVYLDVRPGTSLLARLRVFIASPRIALELFRLERRDSDAGRV